MSTTTSGVKLAQFGIIGLGVMGENLALNVEDQKFGVAVWNLESDWIDRFLQKNPGRQLTGSKTLAGLVSSLARPRKILMMIKAGDPVDLTLHNLVPLLEPGDIVIDGGNSWFKDTQRREASTHASGVKFFGMGVSGGEEGARYGPSLMPGGEKEAYQEVKPILEAIAAKTDSGACVAYVGPDGAGHFVKMVHNGIEYGDMQLIAEAYDVLHKALGLSATEVSTVFAEWNRGPLESFLIEITAKIFTVRDPESKKPLVDVVLDKAGQKGTGKWTAQVALDLGIPIPTVAAALDARFLSGMKDERVRASTTLKGPSPRFSGEKRELIASLRDALYASKICSYAQGMRLIQAGSDEYHWNIDLKEMARIWKGGCIIRARLLNTIVAAFDRDPKLPNLLLDKDIARLLDGLHLSWRKALGTANQLGIPVPAMSASLAYFDSYRSANLPQNLTQAQRDLFGAHTYERVDRPGTAVHTDWQGLIRGGSGSDSGSKPGS